MIRPVGNFVLVKRDSNPEQSEGGIHLIQTDEPQTGTGKVMAVGDLVSDVCSGDYAVFPRYAGTEITIDQEVFLVLRDTDILATLEA